MLTRRQKRSIKGFVGALSCCLILSAVLVYFEISEGITPEVVVVSDILDGAMVSYNEEDTIEYSGTTFGVEELYESMYSDEILTLSTTPVYEYFAEGAGGTLLINTTPTGEVTKAPVSTTTTKKPAVTTVTKSETGRATTVKTTAKTTSATKSTTKTTTAKATSKTTSKTPFINVGGGKLYEGDDYYMRLLTLVNQARKANGLNELWYSARIHEVCEVRATELSSYYSHSRPNGTKFATAFTELGIKYVTVGENIAYGRNTFETPEEVFAAWMKSESHRDNILYPDYECCAFGLSVLKVGKDTYYYWTQEFGKLK
ncbi:MAG: CAP domain-containing protein [Ruminiclostridium sp.]